MSTHLIGMGFVRGTGYPVVFHNPTRNVWTTAHGDDCLSSGYIEDLQWFKGKVSQHYDIKTQILRPGDGAATERKVLNRVIVWSSAWCEFEADPPPRINYHRSSTAIEGTSSHHAWHRRRRRQRHSRGSGTIPGCRCDFIPLACSTV